MAESVGFIGLGIMGEPMAMNLVRAGYRVSAFSRRRERAAALERAGARVASSPADAARDADYVMTIVSDSAASEEVIMGKDGVLQTIRPGAIVIDSATISPVVSRRLACATAGKKASFLDAPVTGSKHGAEKGELTFMIGGDRETFEKALPLLKVLGKKHIYCGAHGAGLSAKLAQNAIQSTMVEIFCEGFVLAAKSGVKPEVMFEIIQNSLARAALTDFKAPFIFRGDFTPYFPLKWMHKDVTLAMEAAYSQGVPMPVTAAVKEVYAAARAQGKGDLDYAAVVTFLEELAGVKVRAAEEAAEAENA
ncbi:MAG TPA: NAD(P)-dependent oxidoreductase [Terriglobia bacterium]|jgi:3-hydroxyisobutyrate dehydrogenase-like beta-hydroxyacid dehydrogenase|nr:NAD(P)-dependent oxidoreductase [Terriglobia bacterium]